MEFIAWLEEKTVIWNQGNSSFTVKIYKLPYLLHSPHWPACKNGETFSPSSNAQTAIVLGLRKNGLRTRTKKKCLPWWSDFISRNAQTATVLGLRKNGLRTWTKKKCLPWWNEFISKTPRRRLVRLNRISLRTLDQEKVSTTVKRIHL